MVSNLIGRKALYIKNFVRTPKHSSIFDQLMHFLSKAGMTKCQLRTDHEKSLIIVHYVSENILKLKAKKWYLGRRILFSFFFFLLLLLFFFCAYINQNYLPTSIQRTIDIKTHHWVNIK